MNSGEKKATVVKFVARGTEGSTLRWLRQFPGRVPAWGGCRFAFDNELPEYDWLVVYDDLPSSKGSFFRGMTEKLACLREHTLLITMEPPSVKLYGASFLKQFGHILTSHDRNSIDLPSVIRSQPALRWYYGISAETALDYDAMKAAPCPSKKAVISTVCSSKQQSHTLHKKRYDFVQWLHGRMPDLDIFGHGVRAIEDKAEAIDPYQYHLAIENHIGAHHWTEKLSDCFLGWSLPIYCGCPNVSEYFPEKSVISIDIERPHEAEEIIRQAIASDEYANRLPAIAEARRLVLDEYNLFAVISRLIGERGGHNTARASTGAVIHSRHAIRRKRMMWPLLELALDKKKYRRSLKQTRSLETNTEA